MKRIWCVLVVVLAMTLVIAAEVRAASSTQEQEEIKMPYDGPVVVATSPATYTDDVSVSRKKVTVRFDRAMRDNSWSWCQENSKTFPQMDGKVHYDSKLLTCTMPVKLEAGKAYWISINSPGYRSFKTQGNKPAKRHIIVFATKGKNGKATAIPADMLARARAINESTAEDAEPSKADEKEAEGLAAQGWQLWNARKLPEAQKVFEKAVAKDPTNVNAWNGLGWARQNQGMLLNAEDAFRKCIGIEPKHAAALNGLGWICKAQKKTKEAIRYWEQAIGSTPQATAALNGLASIYLEQEKYDLAVKYYQMWLQLDPTNQVALQGMEKAKAKGGDFKAEAPADTMVAAPKLERAPWKDGEVLTYDLKTPVGLRIGCDIWQVRGVSSRGKKYWSIRQYLCVTVNNTLQYTRVVAEEDSFAPVSGVTKNALGEFRAKYKSGSVKLKSVIGGNSTTRNFPIEQTVYDNEQAIHLIRRMPLKEGYSASFPIFPVTSSTIVQCKIEVIGKEKITVPAGTFESYIVNLEVYAGAIKALQQKFWISVKDHYPLKIDATSVVMELQKIEHRKRGSSVVFEDDKVGFSVTIPGSWQHSMNTPAGGYKTSVYLMSPELSDWAMLLSTQKDTKRTLKQVAEADIEVLNGFFKGYKVRDKSWKSFKIHGMEALSYVADYAKDGKEMVEYRVFVLNGANLSWFVFRTKKEKFASHKKVYDGIAGSYKTVKR